MEWKTQKLKNRQPAKKRKILIIINVLWRQWKKSFELYHDQLNHTHSSTRNKSFIITKNDILFHQKIMRFLIRIIWIIIDFMVFQEVKLCKYHWILWNKKELKCNALCITIYNIWKQCLTFLSIYYKWLFVDWICLLSQWNEWNKWKEESLTKQKYLKFLFLKKFLFVFHK
jgi:hypothetical protein